MLLSLEEFRDQARAAWDSCSDLWTEYEQDDDVLHDRHALFVPEQMADRVETPDKVYSHIAAHKLDLAVSLLTEPGGPDIHVIGNGVSGKASTERETVQECVTGIFNYWDTRTGLFRRVTRDNLLRLGAFLVIRPDENAYSSKPYDDDAIESELKGAAAEGGEKSAKKRAREIRKANERAKAREMPVLFDLLPAAGCVLQPFGSSDPDCLWSFSEESVKSVLGRFTDEDGNPLATKLEQSVKDKATWNDLADDASVVVVTRIDREHIQRVVLSGGTYMVPESRRWETGTEYGADDEILDEFEHHMECVPVAYFQGRLHDEREPAKAFHGFVQPIRSSVQAYDNLLTQRQVITRNIAWPMPIAYSTDSGNAPMVANQDDQPKAQEMVEGAINYIARGWRIDNFNWTSPEALAFIDKSDATLITTIERLTLPPTTSGYATTSGYQQALVQAQAELVLEPNVDGLQRGWIKACQLTQQAAMVVIDRTGEPVLVHHVDRDQRKYVQLTLDLVEDDWQFEVNVKTRPMGGEFAQTQAIQAMEQAGYRSHEEATEMSGNKRPQRTFRQIRHESFINAQEVQQFVIQQSIMAAIPELAANPVGMGPENPVIPDALANVIGSANAPKAQSRLPAGAMGMAGIPGANGAMNPAGVTPQTGHSLNGPGMAGSVPPGGNPPGQMPVNPGGMAQQDITNAAFGGVG